MTEDLTEDLRRATPRSRRPLDMDAVRRRGAQLRRRRRLAASGTVTAVLAGLAVVAVTTRPSPPSPDIAFQPSEVASDASETGVGTWRELPPPGFPFPPMPARVHRELVWDGAEVVVVLGHATDGGASAPSSALAYDPAANAWRALPSLPVSAVGGGVAVEGGVLVWPAEIDGSTGTDPALLDRVTGAWRSLPGVPEPLVEPAVAWSGREALFYGDLRGPQDAEREGAGFALDPASGAWRRLPAAPDALVAAHEAGGAVSTAWSGAEFVVRAGAASAAYDPVGDRWRSLPDLPGLSGLDTAPLTLDGADGAGIVALVPGSRSAGPAALRLVGDRWQPLPAIPDGTLELRTTDLGVLAIGPRGWWRHDTAAATWRRLATPPAGAEAVAGAVWTGEELVVLSGVEGSSAAAAWRP